MAGAFHGVGEADVIINVGVSGPGVVKRALEKVRGQSFDVVAKQSRKRHSRLLVSVSWLGKWRVNALVLTLELST